MINLTKDKSLQPSGHAIDLLEKTIKASNGFPFHSPIMDSLWGKWLTGEEKGLHTFCSSEDIEWRIFHSIPVFIVNQDLSGTNVFCTELKRTIHVPKDEMLNSDIEMFEELKEDGLNYENWLKQYADYVHKHDISDNMRSKSIIDLWGAFTILEDNTNIQPRPWKMGGIPAIFIWMDKIKGEAKTETECDMLFVEVMLHELAHAFMYSGMFSSGNFFKFREESLANAYALTKIKEINNTEFYNFAQKDVLSQPDNYALGAKYADSFGVNEISDFMRKWTDIKQKIYYSILKKKKLELVYIE